MKYIDADKLKKYIEYKRDCVYDGLDWDDMDECQRYAVEYLDDILSFITSLQQEQPEIDLEKEIEYSIRLLNGHHTLENGERWYKGQYEELRDFARHFWNKGYNAGKEK